MRLTTSLKALTIMAAAFLILSRPANVWAVASCACVRAEHVITRNIVKEAHASTVQQIKMHTTREAMQIRDKIEEVGSVLQQETRAQTSATTQMFEAQNQLLKDLFEAAGLAREKAILDRQYGENAMPPTGCESVDLGASMRSGTLVRTQIKEQTVAKAVTHAGQFTRAADAKREAQRMLNEAPPADQLANAMFSNVIDKDDQKAALESIFYLTDPHPPRPLTDHELQKPQGVDYETDRSLRNRQMALVQQVLADHVARRMPSMPLGAWAGEQWEQMGGEGDPPGVVDGLMSSTSVVDMLVESRIGNPNWTTNTIPSLNDTGLKREQLYIEAARLYIEREQMRMMEQLLVINALNMANRLTTETDAQLRQQQINMEQ